MAQWFYRAGDDQIGPISAEALRDLAKRGRLSASSLVRRTTDENWVRAGRVQGLFPTDAGDSHAARQNPPTVPAVGSDNCNTAPKEQLPVRASPQPPSGAPPLRRAEPPDATAHQQPRPAGSMDFTESLSSSSVSYYASVDPTLPNAESKSKLLPLAMGGCAMAGIVVAIAIYLGNTKPSREDIKPAGSASDSGGTTAAEQAPAAFSPNDFNETALWVFSQSGEVWAAIGKGNRGLVQTEVAKLIEKFNSEPIKHTQVIWDGVVRGTSVRREPSDGIITDFVQIDSLIRTNPYPPRGQETVMAAYAVNDRVPDYFEVPVSHKFAHQVSKGQLIEFSGKILLVRAGTSSDDEGSAKSDAVWVAFYLYDVSVSERYGPGTEGGSPAIPANDGT